MRALTVKDLHKTYSNQVKALKGIDFHVEQGDFFGLLGANGAGKSTTIGIITSLIKKTRGTIDIFGYSLDTQATQAKLCLGIVPQEFNFNIFESCEHILVNQAGYYGIPRSIAKQRAYHFLDILGLKDKLKSSARTLSGGMKRRLMIARALMNEPKILILDEPTAGVDVEIRRIMWDFLKKTNQQGITIILTTHYLEEAEQLCKNIAIIDQGRLIAQGATHRLLAKLPVETLLLYTKHPLADEQIQLEDFVCRVIQPTILEVDIMKQQSLNRLFHLLHQKNIVVCSIRNKSNRLEQLFLQLIHAS